MVRAAAYLALALVVLGIIAFYLLVERARGLAAIDRRLGLMAGPHLGAVRTIVPISVPERVAPLLAQAQVEMTLQGLRNLALAGLAIVGVVLFLAGPVAALALLAGIPFCAWSWLQARARKRTEALTDALPLYLDGVRQLQAIGNSLSQALERALADAPEIVRSYFAGTARRLEMGAPVGETMQQLADRLRIPEVSMLAAAIRTNLRFGGSLGATLTNLAAILRERVRIRRELAAATSEARISSRVLIAMPLLAMIMLVATNPAYIDFFIHDARGQKLSVMAIGLELIGILVVSRMMRLAF
ncbi:tight adherence protein B [Novosphingobium sp. PhB165]|uniref:type II secretion system F family protein n=1 Tax=Novosphingobium sp. PhB165 TaxID=2485105 RepID=UPI0010508454|nr:type II secretion system F family protein [Novosphingobium sp. PhB165]TCM15371.1 tight adherence protein B [Novosphingobium sp. PhB165]